MASRKAPGQRLRFWIAAALVGGLGFAAAVPLVADTPRVRSSDPTIARLINQAAERSHTFRALVDSIGRTDGIVYVETGRCGHGLRACLLMSVTKLTEFRFLRVLIDTRNVRGVAAILQLMASVGHELRHAMEVLSDPTLTTRAAVYFFYATQAPTSRAYFETSAALEAGDQIRRELTASAWTPDPL